MRKKVRPHWLKVALRRRTERIDDLEVLFCRPTLRQGWQRHVDRRGGHRGNVSFAITGGQLTHRGDFGD